MREIRNATLRCCRRSLGVLALACFAASSPAATFEEQRKSVAASIESQPETALLALLKSGIAESRPAQAAALASEWLRHNQPGDPGFFYYAGRNNELAGDLRGAVALYQQFLEKGEAASPEAGEAITAVHAILLQELNDIDAAYSFGLNQSARLAVNPRFRQFDRWFLDTAQARGNLAAVAARLLAVVKTGAKDDLLVALHDADFRWLEQAIRATRYDEKAKRFTPEFVTTVRELAKAIRFDEERALLLDWSVAVKACNMALIDGNEANAPVAEATVLLERYPVHAALVQTDWAGGHNGQHYRDDPKKYWPRDLEAKMAPVRAALPKLSPLAQADLLRTWSRGYYAGGPEVLTPAEARAMVVEKPDWVNRKAGPSLGLEPEKLTHEEAAKFAPLLLNNPSPEASYVRAIAAAGAEKDLARAIDALCGPEVWRLGFDDLNGGRYADLLWHWAGRPGGNGVRDQGIARMKQIAATLPKEDVAKTAPADQRLAAFANFWNDFRSSQPKLPAVRSRLLKVLQITPEAVPGLLADASPEARMLLREALPAGITGTDQLWVDLEEAAKLNVSTFAPGITYLIQRHARNGLAELKQRFPQKCKSHPLEAELRKAVAVGLQKNDLESWLVLAWLNAQFPEDNAEQTKLAMEVAKSPVWKSLSPEARFGLRSWFQKSILTQGQLAVLASTDASLACKDLLALPKDADAVTAARALAAAVDALLAMPVRTDIPAMALENLAALPPEVFADPAVIAQVVRVIDTLRTGEVPLAFGTRLVESVTAIPDPAVVHRVAPYLWQHINRHTRIFAPVKALTESLLEEHPSAASALARAGLEAIARHRGHTYYDAKIDIPLFKSIRGRAALQMGLVVIPVPPGDPAYPIYQSQAEWTSGNEDSAWTQLDANWDAFMPIHREMSVPYLMWALRQTIFTRAEARQEALVRALLGWAGEAGSPLTAEEKARIELAYGDIAIQRGQLREAREIFSRTEKNEAYKDLPVRLQATLRRAAAERLAKDFDGALNTLNELSMLRVQEIWADIRYARAEVYYDMEEFEDAKDDIDAILDREPNHPDARILLGKVQLKRQKLMEATEVELGSSSGQRSLVPGEKLKVTLNDPTLAVSGAGTEIEVKVWAKSGDKEQFFLR